MAKRKSISYSQFSQWDKCPWMWKLNYVERLGTFTDNIHTLFGTSMHEVLQEYLRVMYTKSIKEADQLYLDEMLEDRLKINFLEIVKKNGGVEFCTKDQMVEFYADGVKIIDFFKKKRNMYFSKRGYKLIGCEVPIDVELKKNINNFEIIKAMMPGGSVIGCPKINTLNLLNNQEKENRNIYTGSFGYIKFNGDMRFNIIIRSILNFKNISEISVASGVVVDSNANHEFNENFLKAKALIDLFK